MFGKKITQRLFKKTVKRRIASMTPPFIMRLKWLVPGRYNEALQELKHGGD